MGKRRVVLVGNGSRSFMYRDAAAFKYPATTGIRPPANR